MKLVVAEDEKTFHKVLHRLAVSWGYDIISAHNGIDAWDILQNIKTPYLAILDRMMPGLSGLEICEKLRKANSNVPNYIILLTALNSQNEIVEGFEAGADDYIAKPFYSKELHLRIKVGERLINLQASLTEKIEELTKAVSHIKTLQGILPVCSFCYKIRSDKESWQRLENYLSEHSDIKLSHTMCPECAQQHFPSYYAKIQQKKLESDKFNIENKP